MTQGASPTLRKRGLLLACERCGEFADKLVGAGAQVVCERCWEACEGRKEG